MTRALLVSILLAAATAHANVWEHAIGGDLSEAQLATFNEFMTRGDEAVGQATGRSVSLSEIKAQLRRAEDFYRKAAAVRPSSPEPYYRIAELLHSFYFCDDGGPYLQAPPITCDRNLTDMAIARRVIDAWDKFEQLAPLDPRVTELLTERAILHTKLVVDTPNGRAHLEAAAHDYKAYLDRNDAAGLPRSEVAVGNLAETYMMLGDLDQAITLYGEAVRAGSTPSIVYGLAVALDRDGRADQARELIVDSGVSSFEIYRKEFRDHQVFYVPAGEEHYYLALIFEAFGEVEEAIDHWQRYIASGAHPEFQPRAKEHLQALDKQRKKPNRSAIEPPWPTDIFP